MTPGMAGAAEADGDFPWELGVFDAHCHPTDTMESIDDIPAMKAQTLTIMATRGKDQELVSHVAHRYGGGNERVYPCFGWHPWFSHQVFNDTQGSSKYSKEEHYKTVLTPPLEDENLLNDLPEPRLLSTLISQTRTNLQKHPGALVGEIGLDRSFRIPNAWFPHELESRDSSRTPGSREGRTLSPYRVRPTHQKAVLKAQLQLAGELQRPVSVHSVQSHGAVLEVLRELWSGHEKEKESNRSRKRQPSTPEAHGEETGEETERRIQPSSAHCPSSSLPFPPKICMHSYSGPPEQIKLFLHPSNPSEIYFSFSYVINFSGASSKKATEVIKILPERSILVESDLHCAGEEMDDQLEKGVRQICTIRGWTLRNGIAILAENWKRFVS